MLRFFNLGFRPFFLGAAVFAIITVVRWLYAYVFNMAPVTGPLTLNQWHAHEMIYGYGLAVIAGFLLSSIKRWTGLRTHRGRSLVLVLMFTLWVLARLCFIVGAPFSIYAAWFDLGFNACLFIALVHPVIRAGNPRLMAMLAVVLLLFAGNVAFYGGAHGLMQHGIQRGIYGGMYAIIGLILLVGGRLIPGFIERGVGYPIELYNPPWLSRAILLLFPAFFIVEVFVPGHRLSGYLALALFMVNAARLISWYTPGIWKKPLVWSLYVALLFITTGFLLQALGVLLDVSGLPAVHAFAYGGIGIITLAMMGRIAIGYTGRSIHNPPAEIACALLVLAAGAVVRVVPPLLDAEHYVAWIALSQVLWITAFLLFVASYGRCLIKPIKSGRSGRPPWG